MNLAPERIITACVREHGVPPGLRGSVCTVSCLAGTQPP